MLAGAAQGLLPQVGALLHPIAAGGDGCHGLALPQGRAFFVAVVLAQGVDTAIQRRLHRRGAAPQIDGAGQQQQVTVENFLKNRGHIVINDAVRGTPVPLAAPAGHAGTDGFVIEGVHRKGVARRLPLVQELSQQGAGITLRSAGRGKQNAAFHGVSPFRFAQKCEYQRPPWWSAAPAPPDGPSPSGAFSSSRVSYRTGPEYPPDRAG